MKKHIFLIILLLSGLGFAQTAPSTTENFIHSTVFISDPTLSNPAAIETVQYFDGLGRPKQVINIKASPAQKDVVTHIEYDQFGRQVRDYLPVPQQGTQNGAIYTSPLSNTSINYGPEKIYSEKILENSPLERIQQQIQVGNDWSGKPVNFSYDTNVSNEVRRIGVIVLTDMNGNEESYLGKGWFYVAGSLYKKTVIDEDGNKTIEFTDKYGNIVLLRKILDGNVNADTYYIYNDFKQLVYVIPPLAVPAIDAIPGPAPVQVPETIIDNLCYQYRYDGRNRLVEKKLPGKGWEYMVYDKAGRLILTQDANLEQQGKWMITKYDPFGRVAYTGIQPGGNRSNMQNQITNLVITEARDTAGFTKNGMLVYYTNGYFTNIQAVLSVNYYDTYPTGSPALPAQVLGQDVLSQDAQNHNQSTKSLPVASYVKNIEDDNWTKAYTWYDKRGRAVGIHSINHLGGYTRTESLLDFAGVPQQAYTYHRRLNTDTEKVIAETFTYDHQNRLLEHSHQVDSHPAELLAQNEYNELSQLTNKQVGNGLQSIDYEYNIRGWMTKINDPNNLGNDLFGYIIRYTDPVYTNIAVGRYNGNIAEVDWADSRENILKRYTYHYDGLNRLLKGNYSEPNASLPQNGFYNEELSYDVNGNILSLKRNRNNANIGAELIDDLNYSYAGNTLNSINDVSNNYFGYPADSGNIITYDSNGNMVKQEDQGLLQINYNHLNLPNYMKFSQFVIRNNPAYDTQETVFRNMTKLYRADGVKQKKIHHYFAGRTRHDVTHTTEYLDGFQYSTVENDFGTIHNNGLQFVPTAEGYFDFVQNKYIYQYKDQVGSVRLSFYHNGSGTAIIDRTGDFYPFGLAFGGESTINTSGSLSPNYQYAFQEQERQQETGWDSFKWRNYDPSMGRFFNIDPLSEKFPYNSTYAFQENKMGLGRELEGLELLQERGLITATGMTVKDIYHKGSLPSYMSYLNYKSNYSAPQRMDVADLPSGVAGMGKWGNDGHFTSFAGDSKLTKALGIVELVKQINTAWNASGEIKAMGENAKAVDYRDKLTYQFDAMQTAQEVVNKADLKLDAKTKTEITNYVFDGSLPKDINNRSDSVINLGSKSNIVNTANSIMKQNDIIIRKGPEVQRRQELEQQRMEQQNKLQNIGR